MSILIKGIEMPHHGMVINIYADGRVTNHFDEFGYQIGTAVPVPPHGRLIDVDALPLEGNVPTVMMHNGERWISAYELAMAPIIIPAEPPKEEA